MGFLIDAVNKIASRFMRSEAEKILADLKAACPKKTGDTAETFCIMDEQYPDAVGIASASVFVGSTDRRAYWADEGNGIPGTKIYPRHTRTDGTGKPPMLGEYPSGIPSYGWRPYVHAYEGKHFVREVARKYR